MTTTQSRPRETEPPEPPISTEDSLSMLRLAAANIDDIQRVRIATNNRIGALLRSGNHVPHAQVEAADFLAEKLAEVEDHAKMMVERAYRDSVSPGVRQWQEARSGVGAFQLGRLLGVIGHPRTQVPKAYQDNPTFDDTQYSSRKNPKRILVTFEPMPRSVDQLCAYCGLGDPAMKHTKGMSAELALRCGNPSAKTLVFRIMRQCRISAPNGYYTEMMNRNKNHYGITRPDWSPGHNDQAAIRRTAKGLLADLHEAASDWPFIP
jgi:hypothetical protein